MKPNRFKKGIVTLVFFLALGFCTLFASVATAYAGNPVPKLNVRTKALVKGRDYALKVYNLSETQTVTFTSSAPKTASVDESGIVSGLSVGTAIISVDITDSATGEVLSLQCKINVGPPAFLIKLSRQQANLVIGQRTLMSWMIAPLNTVELPKFSSSDPMIASVSAGGAVTAKSAGTAYIFAQINNGQYSVCRITVTEEDVETTELPTSTPIPRTERTFTDFLIDLNANFTNGDNSQEHTGVDSTQ